MVFEGDTETRVGGALRGLEKRFDAPLRATRLLPTIMMPLHLAIDSAPYVVTSGEIMAPVGFLKVFEAEAVPFVDFTATLAASNQAADLQIAPAALHADDGNGAILYENLGADWYMARRGDLDDRSTLGSIIAAKRRFHRSALLPISLTPFQRIAALLAAMQSVRSPDGKVLTDARTVVELKPWIARIEQTFQATGVDSAPTHGESTMSNVMLTAEGGVRLVDFDRAANADPLFDLGAFCLEFCSFPEDVDEAVEMYCGAADPAASARAKLYMVVDDFLWGCWATLNHFTSARSDTVEFFKYGQNRFLRCKYWLSRLDAEAMMRRV